MRTKRAQRLAKFLDSQGWTVYSTEQKCKNCGHAAFSGNAKFCERCGKKMPPKQAKDDALEELEKAIAYALQEK